MASPTNTMSVSELTSEVINVSIDKVNDEQFDYHRLKKQFNERVQSYFQVKERVKVTKWTKDALDDAISEIKLGTYYEYANQIRSEKQCKLMAKYDVIEQNGNDILFLKKPDAQIVQIVPIDDYFDIILEAHNICGHGGNSKTMNLITPTYYIPQVFVNMFLILCNVCQRRKTKSAPKPIPHKVMNKHIISRFNSTVQIGFVSMRHQRDGLYDQILYYVDKTTRYILLRATQSNKSELEVSMELLKIFLDFGPPRRIETYSTATLSRAVELLRKTWPVWDISVIHLVSESVITSKKVLGNIERWMDANFTQSWAVGCRMVQMQMNTTQISGKLYTPYSSVFGFNPNYLLISKPETVISDTNDDQLGENNTILDDESEDVQIVDDSNSDVQCISLKPEEQLSNQILEANKEIVKVFENESQVGSNTFNRKGSPVKDVLEKNLSSRINKCSVCKIDIIKDYPCSQCNKSVHLLCCKRFYNLESTKQTVKIMCFLCRSSAKPSHALPETGEIDD